MRFKLSAFILMTLIPCAVFAADAHHEASLSGLFWRISVFATFLAILLYLLSDKVKNGLDASVKNIKDEIGRVEKACADSEAELADYTRKMVDMAKELEAMKASARNTAEKEVEKMLQEAERMGKKMREFAKSNIESETVRAKDLLRKELVNMAIDSAERELAANRDTSVGRDYMKNTINKIGA